MTQPSTPVRTTAARRRPHVVVLGGGFGGLTTIKALAKSDVDITLVDRHTYNAFQPLLYQVATAGLNPGDVTFFLRATRMAQKNVSFRQGEVTGIDTAEQRITFHDGGAMEYDYLVIASGATTNYFGTKGAEENSRAIYTRAQALKLRDEIFTNLEHAAASNTTEDLAIVVVGAGPTGVEMAGALAELRNDAMASIYPELDPRRTHIVLVEMADKVLAPFAPSLREYAAKALRERGVELRLNTSVAEVTTGRRRARRRRVPQGRRGHLGHRCRRARRWSAPGACRRAAAAGSPWTATCGSTGFKNIFAVGDVAIYPDALPQLAQPALQGGKHAGKQIAALVTGRPTHVSTTTTRAPWRRSAVAPPIADIALIKGKTLKLTGTLAWLAWLFVHIVMLLGNRNRLATLVNLSTKYLAPSRRTNPIVGDVPVFEHQIPEER